MQISLRDVDNILVVSDFNADVLVGLCINDSRDPKINATCIGFGQVIPTLLDLDADLWREKKAALIWTLPQSVSDTFVRAKFMEPVNHEVAIQDVDVFCDAIIATCSHVATILVATWVMSDEERGYGMLDLQKGLGVRSLLARMNHRLEQRLSERDGIFVLDSSRWFRGKNSFNPKMWYLAKVPFSNNVFKADCDQDRPNQLD